MPDADEASIDANLDEAFRQHVAWEQWPQAAQARMQAAEWAWQNGRRRPCLTYLDEAIRIADDHDLAELAGRARLRQFDLRVSSDASGAALDAVDLDKELGRLLSFAVSAMMLGASRARAIDDPVTAGKYLTHASKIAESLPQHDRWVVELELARHLESRGRCHDALAHAESALRFVRPAKSPMLAAQALAALVPLRAVIDDPAKRDKAREELDELERSGDARAFEMALILRAQARYGQARFAESIADLDRALAQTTSADLRLRALGQRMLGLRAIGDDEAALACTRQALSLLHERESSDQGLDTTEWRDRLQDAEGLFAAAAWFAAAAGRLREAFEHAENGRALRLRRELARAQSASGEAAGLATGVPAVTSFDQLHAALVDDSAALLLLSVLKWGTLALLADFAHPEPRAFLLDLSAGDVGRLLSPKETGLRLESDAWTERVFVAVPELSAKLATPLEAALRGLAPRCRTLYIGPDSHLYRLPFAALAFPDGSLLVQQYPIALAPSAAAFAACRARRFAEPGRSILAYGMGAAKTVDERDIYFAMQARHICGFAWKEATLLPERTARRDLLAAFGRHAVIHLACHGASSSDTYDTVESSSLELFPPERLTARDVLLAGVRLRVDVVFLNACQSGNFRMTTRTEADGFWRAFLVAGATSLVATLIKVDPESAERLAFGFYEAWLDGAPKGVALQRAQLAAIARGEGSRHWAAHVLIGDAA